MEFPQHFKDERIQSRDAPPPESTLLLKRSLASSQIISSHSFLSPSLFGSFFGWLEGECHKLAQKVSNAERASAYHSFSK
jgi:hypothetical protein